MIKERLAEYNPDMLFAEGFDKALIGVCRSSKGAFVAAYDFGMCVQMLVEDEGMCLEEAIGWMEYNVIGSHMGDHTPVFIEGVE